MHWLSHSKTNLVLVSPYSRTWITSLLPGSAKALDIHVNRASLPVVLIDFRIQELVKVPDY